MNTKEFIKEYLLDNGYGVYATIVDAYRPQMAFLKKTARFRRWLAEELDIPIEKINLSSLNSALQQQRKKEAKAGLTVTANSNFTSGENSGTRQKSGFKFSKPPSGDDKNSRIQEM